jgi:hypothetical protein
MAIQDDLEWEWLEAYHSGDNAYLVWSVTNVSGTRLGGKYDGVRQDVYLDGTLVGNAYLGVGISGAGATVEFEEVTLGQVWGDTLYSIKLKDGTVLAEGVGSTQPASEAPLTRLDWGWSSNGNEPGDNIIQWTIANNTGEEISTSNEYTLFFNGEAKESLTLLDISIPAGGSRSRTPFQWDPPTLETGDEFWLESPDGQVLTEKVLGGQPELAIDAITSRQEQAAEGEEVGFDVQATNYGDVYGEASWEVYRTIEVSGSNQEEKIGDVSFQLGSGASDTSIVTTTMPGETNLPGGETLTVFVDEGGLAIASATVILEGQSNLNGNVFVDSVQITGRDYTVGDMVEVTFDVKNNNDVGVSASMEVQANGEVTTTEELAVLANNNTQPIIEVEALNENGLEICGEITQVSEGT